MLSLLNTLTRTVADVRQTIALASALHGNSSFFEVVTPCHFHLFAVGEPLCIECKILRLYRSSLFDRA